MTTTLVLTLAAILVLLLTSAFFSGSETALTAASRSRLHHLAQRGNARARLVERLVARRERMIGAILLGNNAVNILASALATSLMLGFFGEAGVAYATIAMTALIFIFAEVLPKTAAIRNAERTALAVAPVLRPAVSVLAPAVAAVEVVVGAMLCFGGRREAGKRLVPVADELRGLFDLHAQEGHVRKHYRDMLRSILDLSEVEVAEIMTHRKVMVMLNADLPIPEALAAVLESPFTRIPLWRDNPDNIVGVLHAKAMLRAMRRHGGEAEELDLADLAAAPWFVPDTTSLAEQLAAFRARHEHFALVVDEYGSLEGLVTLEDILEEIVGEISDEYDRPQTDVQRQSDGSYVVKGALTIRDINRALDCRIPDEEAVTVAGLVIHEAERIPGVGESFELHGFRFEVLGRAENRLTALRMTSLNKA
ncbi:MAG: HlyC/CorC family transporter [Alphaproteobacteria bacterium]|jgi:Mg2+/Co2+ transporter CorB|nr:HlyC/CorC family transporter [Alphaproteobacteria bacterium]MDP6237969.1 HlyC/CorC family transporter [Alphaproteobacteria bacterium]MDP7172265.1 HlyC/CorC family transporter [Alphaproteobacteria bacterium]MDP7233170.1 HlyC/CorC family transporter [Alphaproteobacteria bacterium]MDP7486681.1 HlyC/CorC family transporter [Alphaproteobacteria bacterium]